MPTSTAESKVRSAKRVATQAINKAAIVAANPALTRSTRTRSSYKIRAEALDQVAQILSGKK